MKDEYDKMTKSISNIMNSFDLDYGYDQYSDGYGSKKVRTGLIVFSKQPTIVKYLNDFTKQYPGLKFQDGSTNTYAAIE